MPEARGGGREEQPTPKARSCDERSYPRPRSGAAARRSYPTPLSPRPMAAAGRSNPMSKEQRLRRRRRAQGSYPTFKVRKGGGEEIPLIQGKE